MKTKNTPRRDLAETEKAKEKKGEIARQTVSTEMEENADKVRLKIMESLAFDVTVSNIVEVVMAGIEYVEVACKGKKGQEKLETLILAIQLMIKRSDIFEPAEPVLIQMVPGIANALIEVDKKGLAVNRPGAEPP
mmetsp:Transcript_19296/g.34348  ORF Transcript_19296/g.34348 Transcript_19296/m.34348 type:complete len:135 (+) Transcript_19296:118-522(+)